MDTIPMEICVQHIRACYEDFVESCGIRHHTFAETWFNCPKCFLHQDSNSAKFLRRECITLYLQFTNILEECAEYGVTDEDLDYNFYLDDMKRFLSTYKDWMEKQFNQPTTIL